MATVLERQSPASTLALYSLPALFAEAGRMAIFLFLGLYLSENLNVDVETLAFLGLVALGSRVFFALIVGVLADLFPGRAGRRRIFTGVAAVMLGAGGWFIFLPVEAEMTYLAGPLVLYEFGAMLFHVAHLAWGLEMTRTYHSRTAVFQWRTIATCFGWVIGLFIGFSLGASPTEVSPKVMGWSAAISSIGLVFTTLLFIGLRSERMPEDYRPVPLEFDDGMAAFSTSPIVRRLIFSGMVFFSMIALEISMHLVVLEQLTKRSDVFHQLLLVEILSAAIMTTVWCRFSLNWGKANAAAAAFLWAALAGFPLIVFASSELTPLVAFVCLRGSAYGGILALLLSMSGDAADVDLFRTGKQRTGTVMAGLIFFWVGGAITFSLGLDFALTGISDAPVDIRNTLWRMIYAIVPLFLFSIAAVVIRSNPVKADVHAEMREEIARQKKRILALDSDI